MMYSERPTTPRRALRVDSGWCYTKLLTEKAYQRGEESIAAPEGRNSKQGKCKPEET